MKRLIALGVCLVVGIELLALILHGRRFLLAASGVALALVLLSVRRVLGHGMQSATEPDWTYASIPASSCVVAYCPEMKHPRPLSPTYSPTASLRLTGNFFASN